MATNNWIGKEVYSVTGPGYFPRKELAANTGIITGAVLDEWLGDSVIVKWEDGHTSRHAIRVLKPSTLRHGGIGVYYQTN